MIKKEFFDNFNDKPIYKYVLQNGKMSVSVLTYGGIVQSILLQKDTPLDVVLGCNTISQYLTAGAYLGAIVGRCANRIENGKFSLNGKNFQLDTNSATNHSHGGFLGFSKRVFDSKVENDTLKLFLKSHDGDQGYPGELNFELHYSLVDTALVIDYFATCSQDTIFAPTSHIYFNLNGENSQTTILNHELQIFADCYTPVKNNLIPTGDVVPVFASPFDFTLPKKIGKDIFKSDEQLIIGQGYDHNFCVEPGLQCVAVGENGVKMNTYSTFCGVQFYAGSKLKDKQGKSVYGTHSGFCLETQFYPNAINTPNFKQPILKKDEKFHAQTKYEFEF